MRTTSSTLQFAGATVWRAALQETQIALRFATMAVAIHERFFLSMTASLADWFSHTRLVLSEAASVKFNPPYKISMPSPAYPTR